jgi:uncharacterized protein (TIGR02246 family)
MRKKDSPPTKTSAENQITKIVKLMMDGFAQQDAEVFASVFAINADCIIRDGEHLSGKKAILETHAKIFSSIYKEGTKSGYEIESIRFLAPDISLVRLRGHMEFSREGKTAEVNGRISLVVNRVEDQWLIALFQNTSVMTAT